MRDSIALANEPPVPDSPRWEGKRVRARPLPVLLDVKGPLELQVRVLVVVNELGHGVVVPAGHHARRCFAGGDCWESNVSSREVKACGSKSMRLRDGNNDIHLTS